VRKNTMENSSNKEFERRFNRINEDFRELVEAKPDTYSEKKYFIKCISPKFSCQNFTITELIKRYPGIVESLEMKELITEEGIDIDHRLNMIRWLWDYRNKILTIFRDAFAFYELIPNSKTYRNSQEHKLLYYDINTMEHYQTLVNPNDPQLKFYTFTKLMNPPEGVVINYNKTTKK
jgi:hypothetical protein